MCDDERDELIQRLTLMADTMDYWLTWNKQERDEEKLDTNEHTAVIVVPPHWPSRGMLRLWMESVRAAADELSARSIVPNFYP